MEMIRAIVRPEKTDEIVKALETEGFIALTKIDVFGRGKQKGIELNGVHYDELAKTMLMLVVEDEETARAVETIEKAAITGFHGDGKIFVTPVESTHTIRTGSQEL